ncbi:MAG: autoinducer binding domain-containing protein [Nitratireductor sp.]|nr:autoinducer binding domain-containing protein [Nitratireductor sp.]
MNSHLTNPETAAGENPSRIAFEKQIRECNSENDIYCLCNRMAHDFGFDYFLILDIPTGSDKELSKLSLITNWPKKLMACYDEYGLLENSPAIAHLRASTEPLLWNIADITAERPDDERRKARNLFESHNIHHGVYFSTHLPNGSIGSVSFCGARPLENEALFLTLNYLASLVYGRLARIRQELKPSPGVLNELELSILSMTADGVPPSEVCEKLAFSEQVLNLRFAQILHKMGAKNRMHAIKLAMKYKMI